MMFDTLTAEQQMLEDTLTALLAETGHDENGNLRLPIWTAMAEAGLLALGVPERCGGMEGSTTDLAVIMRKLGKEPGETPFFSSAILGVALLGQLASAAQWDSLANGLLDGSIVLAPAFSEPGGRYDMLQISTTAVDDGGGYRLTGAKSLVPCGGRATHFIVSALAGGEDVRLFVVPSNADGVTVTPYPAHDGSHDADVRLANVEVAPEWILAEGGAGASDITAASSGLAIAMASAEAVGAMEALLALTVDYLKMRKQFGVPIGSFQTLQHAAVDMFMEVEQAKAMCGYALSMLDAEPHLRETALFGAKAQINAAARFVGETAVQLHGAIGMTMESKAGRLFQRLTRFQLRYGDRNHCLSILADSGQSILEI